MIRRIGILVMAVLLCSCSAEQRLARLLKQHPELRTGTKTVLVPVNIPIPHESASIDIDMSELQAMTYDLKAASSYCSKLSQFLNIYAYETP